jgi:outer membrane receptor protein involved in Fe transport
LLASTPAAGAGAALAQDIAPQPLGKALGEFAHQTGLQLVYVSTIANEQWSKGARAGLSATDALTELLDGTGLTFRFLNERAVRIFASGVAGTVAPRHGTQRRRTSSGSLDEIVVSTRRDAERLNTEYVQSVPGSITVLGGETLAAQKLEQLIDYAPYVPGMNTSPSGAPGQTFVTIRGFGPLTDASPVVSYLDDSAVIGSGPWAYAAALPLDLMPYDLDRFEVLRGPQSTRHGADSEAGIIRYVLKRPSLSDFQASVAADFSAIRNATKPGGSLRAMVNMPVVSGALALRVSGYGSYTPGYVDNLYSGETGINVLRQYGGRLTALWHPLESLSVTVSGLWQRIEADSSSEVSSISAVTVPNTGDAFFVAPVGSYGDLTNSVAFPSPEYRSFDHYAATLHWNPAALQIVSATAWTRNQASYQLDASRIYGGAFPLWSGGAVPPGLARSVRYLGLEKFTEELHINSSHSTRFEWMLGGFYTHERSHDLQYSDAFDTTYQPIPYFAPHLQSSAVYPAFEEWAVFGELTGHFGARFDVTLGARYARNRQDFSRDFGDWNSSTLNHDQGQSSEATTNGMARAVYRMTPDIMLYGLVADGTQPGSPNPSYPGIPPTVGAETLTNYEMGLKVKFLEHAGTVDFAVFYEDARDVQIEVSNAIGGFLANAGRATSQGVEFSGEYLPVHGLRLALSAAYTRCQFVSVLPAADYVLTGYQLSNAPKWMTAATAEYDWLLSSLWQAHVGGAVRSNSEAWSGSGAVQNHTGYPANVIPAYWVLDWNASLTKGPLALKLFIRNLTDRRADLTRLTFFDAANATPTLVVRKLLQPRTFTVGVDYTF